MNEAPAPSGVSAALLGQTFSLCASLIASLG